MRALLPQLTAWVVLVACLLASLAPATELVLCLEPDGSVTLEAAARDACCERSSAEGQRAAAVAGDSTGCPCLDIPLARRSAEPQARRLPLDTRSVSSVPPPPSVPALVAVDAQRPVFSPIRCGEPRAAPGLASIRTVVLRV